MNADRAKPLFSIITPSLNQAHFLKEALQSVRAQSYASHEHLVLDGGSTDETPELLQWWSASAFGDHLSWRSHADRGQSAALNEGFRQAKGEIIGWLNADDRYRMDCFAHVAQTFARHPEIDILYGDYTFIDAAGCHVSLRREIEFNHFVLKYHRVLYIPTASTFIRRRVFEDGHFLRESLHYAMDLEFFLRLADRGYRFQHLPRVLADFRVHQASKSTRCIGQQRREHREIVLQATPAGRWFRSAYARTSALVLLQVLAGMLRYSEKLVCGFYLRERNASLFAEEQIQETELL